MTEIIIPNKKHERIISRLESSPGGITLLPCGSVPNIRDGFIVSLTNYAVNEVTPDSIDGVMAVMQRNPAATMIGGWFSDATKQFFVDASAVVRDIERAFSLARLYNQESIFDVAKSSCIYLH